MAILFSSSDDCRWPKIQFKKPEKMFFVSREFSRFVNFTYLQHFCHYFHHVYCFFDGFPIFLIIFLFFDAFLIIHLFQQINYWFSEKMRKSKKHQKTKILAWIMKKWYDFVVFPHVRSGKISYKSVLKNPFLDLPRPLMQGWQ